MIISELWWNCSHVAWWLHHPLRLLGQHQGRLRQESGLGMYMIMKFYTNKIFI
jgi:hypothetical protein